MRCYQVESVYVWWQAATTNRSEFWMAVNWGASDIVQGARIAWDIYQYGFKEENRAGALAIRYVSCFVNDTD